MLLSSPSQHSTTSAPATLAAILLLVIVALSPSPMALAVSTISGNGVTFAWSNSYRVVQYPLPNASSNPWVITVDASGKIWFVEQGANQLGELDPATGAILQYKIPTAGSTADSVASDSQGNIWLGELTAGKLGELPHGQSSVVEYSLPAVKVELAGTSQSVDCGPGPVVPDSSGTVWIACLFSNQILRFFPTNGSFARFDLPVFESAPAGMLLDGHGNLWFTAADANMLGKAVIGQLRNNTSDGISEFAPINGTYSFTFSHPTSFLGSTDNITSSLPTPSGIAMDPSGRLWVTEHVDSSFDSYDPSTGSLVRYWTSQTNGAYGETVSFPNGIAVGQDGTVWIGEHYGNKVAEFDPTTGQMTEFAVPCCTTTIAGVYSVALDKQGNLWFVEIQGNAIGEVQRITSSSGPSISLPSTYVSLGTGGKAILPLTFAQPAADGSKSMTLSLSGVSSTGALQNLTASFDPGKVSLSPGGTARSNLSLSLAGIGPGIYYLTLTAAGSDGVLRSLVLKLTVSGGPQTLLLLLIPVALVLSGAAAFVAWRLARRSRSGRRPLRRDSRRRANRRTTKATPIVM